MVLSICVLKTLLICQTHSFPSILVAARSKAWLCGCSLAGIVGLYPDGGMDVSLSCECCVLSGRGHCVEPITRTEDSYRLCVFMRHGV